MDSTSLPAILVRVVGGFHHGEGEVSDSCGDIISDWNPISHIPVATGRSSSHVDKEVLPSLLRRHQHADFCLRRFLLQLVNLEIRL